MISLRPAVLSEGEQVEDLQYNGLHIIQNARGFRFGTDAVLLSAFVALRPGDRVVDFGTGTGILPLLLSQREESAVFDAIEIQPDMAGMARRSVEMNGLEERIRILQGDYRGASTVLGHETADAVVCNPPYGKPGGTVPSARAEQSIARHEGECTLSETLAAAASVLKYHGRLYIVFPARRMMDLLDALRQSKLEPKRIRPVCSKISKPPYVLLLEASKGGSPALRWEPPLVVYTQSGKETEEIREIYHRKQATKKEEA